MITDPSGNVTIVKAFPAVTLSPAMTGHMLTPCPGETAAPLSVKDADDVTEATGCCAHKTPTKSAKAAVKILKVDIMEAPSALRISGNRRPVNENIS